MLCRSKECWYPCLFPEFKEKTFDILPSGILVALFFIYVLRQVEDVPTTPSLLGDFFVSGRDVGLVKFFLCICWHVGSPQTRDPTCVSCIYHWAPGKLYLYHSWYWSFAFYFFPDLLYLEDYTFCWSSDFIDFSWGMWEVVPWSGIEPGSPALEVQRLSHWTTRGVPLFLFSVSFLFTLIF